MSALLISLVVMLLLTGLELSVRGECYRWTFLNDYDRMTRARVEQHDYG